MADCFFPHPCQVISIHPSISHCITDAGETQVLGAESSFSCLFVQNITCMEPEGLVPCTQETATGPCPEPAYSSPTDMKNYLRSNQILADQQLSPS